MERQRDTCESQSPSIYTFLKFYLLFLVVLGLRCCAQAFCSCGGFSLRSTGSRCEGSSSCGMWGQ